MAATHAGYECVFYMIEINMIMKKLLLTLSFALASTALFAQIPSLKSMGLDPAKQTDMLMEQLAAKIEM